MGSRFPTPGGSDDDVEARIRDMDEEGVDVQLMLPGLPPATDDIEIEVGFIRANHRFTHDFRSKHPHRLKSLIVVSSRALEASVQEIKTWARAMGRGHSSQLGRRRSHRPPGSVTDLDRGQRRRTVRRAS
jgi:predicted TIM-barrel fold metal-dependent hydrolase